MQIPTQILDKYLARRKEDLYRCMKLLKNNEFKDLERIGHQLKGNGSTFGFPEVSKIGDTLEMSASRLDAKEVEKVLESLSRWLNGPH